MASQQESFDAAYVSFVNKKNYPANVKGWSELAQQEVDLEYIVKDNFRAFTRSNESKNISNTEVKTILEKLCKEHTSIAIDHSMIGGKPHIKGLRLSVETILAKLHYYGNIEAIEEIYKPHLSKKKIKEAIAFAQDFLEMMCDKD